MDIIRSLPTSRPTGLWMGGHSFFYQHAVPTGLGCVDIRSSTNITSLYFDIHIKIAPQTIFN